MLELDQICATLAVPVAAAAPAAHAPLWWLSSATVPDRAWASRYRLVMAALGLLMFCAFHCWVRL